MDKKTSCDLLIFVQNASDSRLFKHLYLKGNHGLDMFHDKVDKINVWNRLWLSAYATGTQIVSAEILDSHLHTNVLLKTETQDTDFMHYFRLSITQYYNQRYGQKGMLGTRRFGRGILKNIEDLKDCICYHIRNVLHHGITSNYMDYPYSTARFVFDLSSNSQQGLYTISTLPQNMAKAYLPARAKLPESWLMTKDGMIVPPPDVFRADIVEALFESHEQYLEALVNPTYRESSDSDEPCTAASHSRNVQSLDEKVFKFVQESARTPLQSMNLSQKLEAILLVREEYPKVSLRTLSRIFGIPATTLHYRLKILNNRE